MRISRTSIERPVFATVLAMLLILSGVIGFWSLPVREYPDVEAPTVSVRIVYPGASAGVVDRDVGEVVEESLSGIEGVELIETASRDGVVNIDVEFALDRDLDAAAADVRDKLGEVRGDLPDTAEEPVVSKTAAQSQAMMWLTLTSDRRDRLELTDLAEQRIVDRFATLPGVSQVLIGGARRYAMRIWLKPDEMAAYGVTVTDVIETLESENIELPAGRVTTGPVELSVRTMTEVPDAQGFADLVVRSPGAGEGRQVELGDVARVELGAEDDRTAVLVDGEQAVGLGIIRQSKSNTIAVSNAVQAEMERLRRTLPEDVGIEVSYDQSVFVRGSIEEVLKTMAITAVLVVAVIFVFLRSPGATLVPAATIPTSLVAVGFGLYLFDYSVNTLTLLAVVLAIGLVVDDGIVVLENIYRRFEQGESRLVAAARGADQIGFAVIATTLVLIAVFVPLAFMTGTVGRLFTEFGVALAVAVGVSSIVALTFGAMLASKVVTRPKESGPIGKPLSLVDRGFSATSRSYRRGLERTLALPAWLTLLAIVGVVVAAVFLFRALPQEVAPEEDRSIFIVPVQAPESASFAYTKEKMARVRELMEPLKDEGLVDRTISIVGLGGAGPPQVNQGLMIVRLVPWGERDVGQQEVIERVQPKLFGIPGVQAFAVNPPSLGREEFSQPVQFVIGGPDFDTAADWGRQILRESRQLGSLIQQRLDYNERKPQVRVYLDRDKAADLGLNARQVGRTLQFLFGEQDLTDFTRNAQSYEVMLQAVEPARDTPEDLLDIYLRGDGGQLVQLRNAVRIEEVGAPAELRRIDRMPSVTISGIPAPGSALGTTLSDLDRLAAENLPDDARISYLGVSEELKTQSAQIYLIFGLALLIVFLVLAAQFESFIHPVIILISVPLAITGGLLGLFVTGYSFNIFSQIGLVLLIGLLAKNGILIVEFANQLRSEGKPVREAIVEAGEVRLRPILMTSIATVMGALPLALATGPGAEGRTAIGIVIIFGVAVATLLALFVVPVLYRLLGGFTRDREAVAQELERQESRQPDVDHAPEERADEERADEERADEERASQGQAGEERSAEGQEPQRRQGREEAADARR
jgi:multidrug efflux pump